MSKFGIMRPHKRRILKLGNKYLLEQGWYNPIPKDNSGEYIPWFTYPATAFLRDVINKKTKVFEYGAGYSTLFFNNNVDEVFSVEHDQKWVDALLKINPQIQLSVATEGAEVLPGGDEIIRSFEDEKFLLPEHSSQEQNNAHGLSNLVFGGYASQLMNKEKYYYDLVVVDGMARALCAYFAEKMISKDGIIVLDNSDRWQYNSINKNLTNNGFGRIDFWGPGPVNEYAWCTSFFSRRFNIVNTKVLREVGSGDLGW
ncbi:MAG: hypothetical protein P4L64_10700 [Caulobacteraceae bacterium]|nr:hypothetical protein [Caulobacteraceae bacterium]